MRNSLRFNDSKHCFANDEKTALREYFGHWWNSKSLSVECCLETKMRRDVKLLYDVMADTIGYIQVKMKAASLQLARTHTRFTHWARFARNEIINSLRSALRASLREELNEDLQLILQHMLIHLHHIRIDCPFIFLTSVKYRCDLTLYWPACALSSWR